MDLQNGKLLMRGKLDDQIKMTKLTFGYDQKIVEFDQNDDTHIFIKKLKVS